MYADDTESSAAVNTCNDIIEKVIPDLMKICDWLKAHKRSLNAVKTEFMLIGTYHNTIRFGNLLAIRIDDHLIKRVHKTKYLGIIVADSLTWNEQIDFHIHQDQTQCWNDENSTRFHSQRLLDNIV